MRLGDRLEVVGLVGVRRHAVGHRAHRVLADAEAQVPALEVAAQHLGRVLDRRLGRAAEIGVTAESVAKVGRAAQGALDTVGRIEAGEVDLVINTVGSDPSAVRDSASLRRTALLRGVPYFTTVAAARAGAGAIRALQACQPYAMLPADRYGEWKVLDLSFTPRDFGAS